MDTSRIGKIEKAKRYAEERERFQFRSFVVTVRGDNGTHTITYDNGKFYSDGPFFQTHGYSAHTIALEYILADMIPSPAETDEHYMADSARRRKIEKAKRYAEERERFQFLAFEAMIRGDNNEYAVRFRDGKFDSDNPFFQTHGYSAHTLAIETVLKGMITTLAESTS